MNDWINVKDRLPTALDLVAFTWDGHEISSEYSINRTTNEWYKINSLDYEESPDRPISHWMPTPIPPQEE